MPAEIILAASSKVDCISVFDVATGGSLNTLKSNTSGLKCTDFIPDSNGYENNGYFLAVQQDKGIIHVWQWQKDHPIQKIFCQEKISCVKVSPNGIYCLAGTDDGTLLCWKISSGALLRRWRAHFRRISNIQFTSNSKYVITGGDDAVLNIWSFFSFLSSDSLVKPLHSLSNHTLPITDIYVTKFIHTCTIVTSSLDKKVYVYDLLKAMPLISFNLPDRANCVKMDSFQRWIFAGCSDGNIYMTFLKTSSDSVTEGNVILSGHKSAVSCLEFSFDESHLISADDSGCIIIWDIESRQNIKNIDGVKGPITGLHVIMKPFNFMDQSKPNNDLFNIPVTHFKRIAESSSVQESFIFQKDKIESSSSEQSKDEASWKEKHDMLLEKYKQFKAMYEEYYEATIQKA